MVQIAYGYLIFFFFFTVGALQKKNDDAVAESRSLKTYLATLFLDYIVIIIPVLMFGTVSVHL